MTEQEMFDFVCTNLIAQGRASKHGKQCRYRGDYGTRCAAGWLISDEDYDEGLEGLAADERGVREILEKDGYDVNLVVALQSAHDSASAVPEMDFRDKFAKTCRDVVKDFRLDDSVLGSYGAQNPPTSKA